MNIKILKLVDLEDFKTYKKYLKLISKERQIKIEDSKIDYQKIVSLFAELLIRFQISNDLKISNKDISFKYNPYGKPFLKNSLNYFFSISHVDKYIVFASDTNPVGIDIEIIKSANLKLAKKFFTLNEYKYILNSQNRNLEFFKIWTLKEAYIKMLGIGLSKPLNSFDVLKLNDILYNTSINNLVISLCYNKKHNLKLSFDFIDINDLLIWFNQMI